MTAADEHSMRHDVADVLVKYASGIDRRDWTLFRTCFTDGCDADYGDLGHWRGADEITAWMAQSHEAVGPTLHRITNMTIESNGSDGAHARSYVDALLLGVDGAGGVRATGIYDDELARTPHGWRIARRRFTEILVEPFETTGQPMHFRALAHKLEIHELLARYARGVDTRDWELWKSVFTEDAVIDYRRSGIAPGTREEVSAVLAENLETIPWATHHVTNIEIDLDGDEASVRAMFFNPMLVPGMDGDSATGGYYLHDMVRTRDGWRSRHLVEQPMWFVNKLEPD